MVVYGTVSVQSVPHAMPVPVTAPLPVPDFVTVRMYELSVNVAVTLAAIVIVTVHAAVPLQPPPLQPANVDPADGAALSVTVVL